MLLSQYVSGFWGPFRPWLYVLKLESSKNSHRIAKTLFEALSLPVAKILSPVARQVPTKLESGGRILWHFQTPVSVLDKFSVCLNLQWKLGSVGEKLLILTTEQGFSLNMVGDVSCDFSKYFTIFELKTRTLRPLTVIKYVSNPTFVVVYNLSQRLLFGFHARGTQNCQNFVNNLENLSGNYRVFLFFHFHKFRQIFYKLGVPWLEPWKTMVGINLGQIGCSRCFEDCQGPKLSQN